MQINQSVMEIPGVISRDELFNLRMNLLQLYKSRIYAMQEVPTSVYGLQCHFRDDNEFPLHLMYKNELVFSFHPGSKIIDFDPEQINSIIGAEARCGNTIGWTLAVLFEQIYREQAGFDQHAYATMTTHETRRNARTFFGLLESVARLSAQNLEGGRGEQLVRRDNGYAIIDAAGMLVFHITKRTFSFGMGYLNDTDIDTNINHMVMRYRPWVIDVRRKYCGVLDQLADLLRTTWRAKEEINRVTSRALSGADMRGIDLKREYAHSLQSGSVICMYDHAIILQYSRGGLAIGTATYYPKKRYPIVDTAVLDYLRGITMTTNPLKDDFQAALVSYSKMITDQVVGQVEQATLTKLGLTIETGRPYYQAFMNARASGYRENFEAFALLIKNVQG